jgi:hypothetical protein
MTDAIGIDGGHDEWRVLVEDGVITQFGFTEHSGMLIDMATFLASEGRFDGYEGCIFGPFAEPCATIQLENLDAWAAWHDTVEPGDRVAAAVASWYRGDCEAAAALSWAETECSASSVAARTTAYESILRAQVSIDGCEVASGGEHQTVACEVQYSNAMSTAVGAPPSVTARDFVLMHGVLTSGPEEDPWWEADYPEDTGLRESFRLFAEGGDLADDYAAADCATARSPECATLVMDNLDAWAAWYEAND